MTPEAATTRVLSWIGSHAAAELAISDWILTEVSSALAFKLRTRTLDLAQRAQALAGFHRLAADSLLIVPVERSHFQAATHFVDRPELNLRAPDALHLAIAADRGATLVTLDRRLKAAALELGVAVQEV